ncbi:MAG: hypothetical protein K9N09_01975 [Candidatus Cloacimonetes bacterium]|nr:hypothetical protein [Candidatus Cloacimonadota bacterium]MCF7813242.1 hypothetical protein [Candidatus Cloacimonadota bacterium]MCF7867441.1 hypothetical protein [Candidatus Cloacimonadota bacterium]MCF7882927.1 hypothetical protein [Candidatus Cloacimonadota bacterium]
MLRKLIILVSLFLPLCLLANSFEVIEMEEDYLMVKFTLPDYQIEKVERNSVQYDRIFCKGAAYTNDRDRYVLPFFGETIGLPIDGNMHIRIIDQHQTKISTNFLLPVQESFYEENPNGRKKQRSNELYPPLLLKKNEPAYLGDRYFCGFSIFPFQYNEATKTIKVTTELTFRIDIEGVDNGRSTFTRSENFIDKYGDEFFLNNRFSQNWRRPRENTSGSYSSNRDGDLVNEVQIIVDEEGIYKITRQMLQDAVSDPEFPIDFEMAFDWNDIDPRFLELRNEYGVVPINFVGEADGSFDSNDYFEFFGDRHNGDNEFNDDFTAENVYNLSLEDHFGSRMAIENGGLNAVNPNAITVPTSFLQTVRIEQQSLTDLLVAQWEFNTPNFFREDIWFWDKITAPSLHAYPFDIQYPVESNSRRFTAEVCLFGLTYNRYNYEEINHKAQININETLIDIDEWYGQTEKILNNNDNPLVNLHLQHGENILYVNLPGIPGIENESVLLDYLELNYWREYKTDTNYLHFQRPPDQSSGIYEFELENFSTPDISVYKLGSSKFENVLITPDDDTGGAPYMATFQDSINLDSFEYIAVTDSMKKVPLKIQPNLPSSLRDPMNSAEYIIITAQEFKQNEFLLQYKQVWEDEGHVLKIVSVEDIFDEFNGGIRSAEAIRDFLSYAYNNWSATLLSHVLLLGDGLTDERDNSPLRGNNLIPFKNVWVEARGAIASDNWMACIIGDDPVADISISRITIWQEDQIGPVLDKSIYYKNTNNFEDYWHSNVTLAAGGNPGEGSFFALQSENVRHTWIPDKFNVKRIYCNVQNLPSGYFGNTTSLISNINDGSVYVQFMGHGGGYVWADYNLLNKYDINTFNNENYPLVSSLSCYGSAFNFAGSSCIGEELILTPGKGAIGHIGFTGYGYLNADEYFALKINQALFGLNMSNVGEIVDFTKAQFYAHYGNGAIGNALTSGCALLGDPFINIYIPDETVDIELNDHNLAVGDTLQFSAFVGNDIEEGKFVIYDENDIQLPLNLYFPFNIPNTNGYINGSFIIPDEYSGITNHSVKLFAQGPEKELVGIDDYSIGQAVLSNLTITPEQPTEYDEIMIGADFFDEDGIDQVKFYNLSEGYALDMVNVEDNYYQLNQILPPHIPGSDIDFRFKIFDAIGDSTTTDNYEVIIAGPDLWLEHIQLSEFNNEPAVKLFMRNIGEIDAPGFNLRIYDALDNYNLLSTQSIDPLAVSEGRWVYVPLPLMNNFSKFFGIINQYGESFAEITLSNNMLLSDIYQMNMYLAQNGTVATSLDNNFECEFSSEINSLQPIIYINENDYLQPLNQPDVSTVVLPDTTYSKVYEVGTLSEDILADSIGHFVNNGSMTIRINYSSTDSLTQYLENQNNFNVYRWEDYYEKWIKIGGTLHTDEDYIEVEVDRIGTYTILHNQDTTIPFVEVNVEDQELTQTYASLSNPDYIKVGYIAKDGIISYTIFDKNGIDIFDRKLSLQLDDGTNVTDINENEFSLTATYNKLTELPVKYQLPDLAKGQYTVILNCHDVNGNPKNMVFEFSVNSKFDILNFANYPNPVESNTLYPENEGRTRFTYVLTDDADEVYIKIYTVSGRLVKTFRDLPSAVGYHEFPRSDIGWDCRDNKGHYLANGVYFYRITATKGNKRIQKTQKMAILK